MVLSFHLPFNLFAARGDGGHGIQYKSAKSLNLCLSRSLETQYRSMIKNEAFEEVYRIIDEVVAQLDVDDDKDRTDKDECEDQRAKKTLEAKEEANSIDDKSARVRFQERPFLSLSLDRCFVSFPSLG